MTPSEKSKKELENAKTLIDKMNSLFSNKHNGAIGISSNASSPE